MINEHYPLKPATQEWVKQRTTISIKDRQSEASKRSESICKETGIKWSFSNVDQLKENGFQLIDPVLTEEEIEDMSIYFRSKKMTNFYGIHESFTLEQKPNHVKMARTDTKTNLLCPHMIDLITNDKIISMASEYLSAPATLNCVFPLWSFKEANPKPINMQLYHRDADDYKFVKLFILLTDTENGNGEQVYVKKSHRKESLPIEMYKIERYSDKKIEESFPEDEVIKIYGKAGKCWLADTYGIHKGTVPTKTNRLLLQLQYTLDPTPIFNYKQFRYSKWDELSNLTKHSVRMYLRR